MGKVLSPAELRSIIVPLLSRHGLDRAFLFGSYARGEATERSDIDLLVDLGGRPARLSVYALGEDVREVTGKRVDVFELSELSDGPFKNAVLSEAIAL